MNYLINIFYSTLIILIGTTLLSYGQEEDKDLVYILGQCKLNSTRFNSCMKNMFNELKIFYKTGIPEYKILPFDPHHCSYVEARRGTLNGFGGFQLILRNVSEYGWSDSDVTKFRLYSKENKFIYSQFFPDKRLEGFYEFTGKILGSQIKTYGIWNLSLTDYSQTTTIRRTGDIGGLIKVHIEVDKIGGMVLHISDFFGQNRGLINSVADTVINSMWKLGLPFMKPLINELVSTAFTDIFNESFRYFPMHDFLNY